MDTCPECGNHDLEHRVVDGATIRECALCGERFGDRRAVEAMSDRDEAARYGMDPEVWPLVRALRTLPELTVEAASAGDAARAELPAIRLVPAGSGALVTLENLATSLQLGAAQLLCPWGIEVQSPRHLTFVLGARGGSLRDARLDLETLRRHLERDMRLSWWRQRTGEV